MKSCEVCRDCEARYRCPRCQLQTCSLTCVKRHKADTRCNGQRDKTAYAPMSELSDLHLLSDYRFLEDVGRKNSNVARDTLKNSRNRPNFVQELQKQARNRHIDLRLMPYPMSRRKHNKSTYHYKQRQILWQIDWWFVQADVKLTDKRVLETDTLGEVLDRHTGVSGDPGLRHKLRPYTQAGRQDWRLYMKVENLPQADDLYHILDLDSSITSNLEHKCVIEYPTIHVVLRQHWEEYRSDCTTNTEGGHSNSGQIVDDQATSIREGSTTQRDRTYTGPATSPSHTEPDTPNTVATETTNTETDNTNSVSLAH